MEPFKELLNADVVKTIGMILAKTSKQCGVNFSRENFEKSVVPELPSLELRQRVSAITDAADKCLPESFDTFSAVMLRALHPSEDTARDKIEFGIDGLSGMALWPFTELVAQRTLQSDRPEEGLSLLKEQTKRATAEFAIRPIIERYPDLSFKTLMDWTKDENRHVRRLVSEGTRPRLPWGKQLKFLIADPEPIMPLLQALRDDREEYVRRSVANNLNDIAKDHAGRVAWIASRWLTDADRNRRRLVKHACRTLIKNGDKGALSAFGYHEIAGLQVDLSVETPTVVFGETLEFKLTLANLPAGHNVMIDYAIHFVKANGSLAAKVFKWKDFSSTDVSLSTARKHAIKPITTRKYYPGKHLIEIIVNGVPMARGEFELLIP